MKAYLIFFFVSDQQRNVAQESAKKSFYHEICSPLWIPDFFNDFSLLDSIMLLNMQCAMTLFRLVKNSKYALGASSYLQAKKKKKLKIFINSTQFRELELKIFLQPCTHFVRAVILKFMRHYRIVHLVWCNVIALVYLIDRVEAITCFHPISIFRESVSSC